MPIDLSGHFASSRATIARTSEILRLEMESFNVWVVTVMCRFVDTPCSICPVVSCNFQRLLIVNVRIWARSVQDYQSKATKVKIFADKVVIFIIGG